MKKLMFGVLGAAVMMLTVPEAMAKPHDHHRAPHHDHNEGLALAAGIVNLVKDVLVPTPVVVAPVPAAPVIVTHYPLEVPKPVIIQHHTPPPRPVVVHHNNKPPRPPAPKGHRR